MKQSFRKQKFERQSTLYSKMLSMWKNASPSLSNDAFSSNVKPSAPPLPEGVPVASAIPTAHAEPQRNFLFPSFFNSWFFPRRSLFSYQSFFSNNTLVFPPSVDDNVTTKQPSDAEQKKKTGDNAIAYTLVLAVMTLIGGLCVSAISWLLERDWQYRKWETIYRRFARGTQRVQSVMELCVSLMGAFAAWKTVDFMLGMTLMLAGVSRDVFLASMLLQGCVLGVSLLAATLGFIGASVACVAFLRWYYPFGTGNGLGRFGGNVHSHLSGEKYTYLTGLIEYDTNSIIDVINQFSQDNSQDKMIRSVVVYRLENLMFFLRALKKIAQKREFFDEVKVFSKAIDWLKSSDDMSSGVKYGGISSDILSGMDDDEFNRSLKAKCFFMERLPKSIDKILDSACSDTESCDSDDTVAFVADEVLDDLEKLTGIEKGDRCCSAF